MTMLKKSFYVAQINRKQNKLAYFITGIIMFGLFVDLLVDAIFNNNEDLYLSIVNYLFVGMVLVAIFTVTLNYKKIINLGAKKMDYFFGCLIFYAMVAAFVALINTICYYSLDRIIMKSLDMTVNGNLLALAGWMKNGAIVGFLVQFFINMTVLVIVHTLTMIQNNWVGWLVDVLIIAVISVFLPITPLRNVIVFVLRILFFNSNHFLLILVNILFATVIYADSVISLKNKKI